MLKSKVLEERDISKLENKLDVFLKNITSEQIVDIKFTCGGSGSSSYFYYAVLVIYNDYIDNNQIQLNENGKS